MRVCKVGYWRGMHTQHNQSNPQRKTNSSNQSTDYCEPCQYDGPELFKGGCFLLVLSLSAGVGAAIALQLTIADMNIDKFDRAVTCAVVKLRVHRTCRQHSPLTAAEASVWERGRMSVRVLCFKLNCLIECIRRGVNMPSSQLLCIQSTSFYTVIFHDFPHLG